MPELAEVEVVRRNLVRWWLDSSATDVRILDERVLSDTTPSAIEAALRQDVKELSRRGKYLFAHLADDTVIVFHFRMTGKLVLAGVPEPKYARLSWLVDKSGWIVFKDQRCLGEVRLLGKEEFKEYEPLQKMGPEPEDITVEDLNSTCSKRRMLKSALLDQSVVAGVGNIAISELFWRVKLAPKVRCGELSDEDWESLVQEMPLYFDEVIEKSMGDEIFYQNEAGMENIFRVYGHAGESCPRCGGEIEKMKVAGRVSYYCGSCQG